MSDITPLLQFAHGLLTHEELIIDGVNTALVSGFDQSEFANKCVSSSPYYDADLSDCDALTSKLI